MEQKIITTWENSKRIIFTLCENTKCPHTLENEISSSYERSPEKNSLSKGFGDVAPTSDFGVPDALLANIIPNSV